VQCSVICSHDENTLLEQHLVYDDQAAPIASSQQAFKDMETPFAADEKPEETR
jgi:hypothetical protein